MTTASERIPAPALQSIERVTALALRLAHAENALLTLSAGQVDGIVDPEGRAYLLRPAQERLRENEIRLQTILDSAGDGITVVHRGGLIVSQNRAATRMLGYGADELVGLSFFDLIDAGELPKFYSAFFNVIEDFREAAIVEFPLRTRDGSYLVLEATVNKLRDVGAASIVLTCRDTTRRSAAQERAARREAELIEESLTKSRFIAMLSHELRTPLSPISLGVAELQEDERFIEARPTLTMIRRNVDLQARLLEELFDFTKVGQHKVRLRLEPVDAHEAVGFVLEICKAEIGAAQIHVLLDLRAPEKMVLADSARLQQIMWNLVKNAVKFSIPGSSISITSANEAAGGLTLQFVDHGVGIEPALLDRIFDPFRQGNHSTPHLSGGLGLGLFIAKGMVEAQEGTLTVRSDGHGKGATFRLTLNSATMNPLSQNGATQ